MTSLRMCSGLGSMAVQWRRCWRSSTGAAVILDWCCGISGRAFIHAASAGRETAASRAVRQVLIRDGPVHHFCKPMSLSRNVNVRYRNRYLFPTQRVCCCSVHTDTKLKDPFSLVQKDLQNLYEDIKKELFVSKVELKALCDYYFDGKGKAFRPMIVVLMARACNIHSNKEGVLLPAQRSIAMISEMIHTASLVHDDVIDDSDTRRGKNTINRVWGERKAILAGDFILSAASMALARIGNNTVVSVLSQVIEDLVRGEFMQLGSKENENERFKHYLEKTFKKTASLIANSCKAVSVLVNSDPEVHEIAYQYGRNVGIAFQFPELHAMIMRRFSSDGDVDRAWQYVLKSDGVEQTNYLAQHYCQEAIRQISQLRPSTERDALIRLTELVLSRDK
ncbi:all trans-polyprenyl-diphosphate synthase PDSS1-like isoform X2 [Myxocyprinus asiaticus]|uniref:all trans-polyprenyl-diphosphate synthase PDSS1-like isoform X2 n=1 Tax=Myxocyprinus asiaticus TaxID=70543 RepID=UPI0022224776|nr:all trans-polyprenyl-diphosphate synthase PDSS1-like isoform X2 [Myxocyprinus asiaticus]